MNITDYTYLINKPSAINDKQTLALEQVLAEFPYFQSARALQLKGLYNLDSYKYNFALKTTAAHTTDRAVLFDFITSSAFTVVQKDLYEKKLNELLNIDVVDSQLIEKSEKPEPKINSLEQSILTSIKEASIENENLVLETSIGKLEIGKPLDFSKAETHSFQEWLQLSRLQPISREKIGESELTLDEEKKKKAELIDKFIETNPKIPPIKQSTITTNFELPKTENSYLMTETLAKVYLEQKKYSKAIQAYEILILKYPEKSSFFADRISDIKILQQYNN